MYVIFASLLLENVPLDTALVIIFIYLSFIFCTSSLDIISSVAFSFPSITSMIFSNVTLSVPRSLATSPNLLSFFTVTNCFTMSVNLTPYASWSFIASASKYFSFPYKICPSA